MQKNQRIKIIFTFIIFLLLFCLVIFKAFYIQILNRDKLISYSNDQFLRKTTIYPNRGSIYDRHGNPLAINRHTYSIFTLPQLIKDKQAVYQKLHNIVPEIDYKQVLRSSKIRNKFTWIERRIQLNEEQVQKVKELEGVYVELEPKRYYPNHELFAQGIGFVGIDNVGLAGLEYHFDKILRGKKVEIKYLKDAKGRAVKFESSPNLISADDIHLTIDKDLQAVVEGHLKDAVIEHKAKSGGVGVMDATTGEILAMANYPSYDPNNPTSADRGNRRLSFISDPFEPGSIFKILTVASGLENKIISEDTNYFCEYGRFKVQNHYITEAESSSRYEWLSVADIVRNSSNVGITKVAFDITYPILRKTLKKFNIGEKVGVELPAESRGIFNEDENISPLSLSNLSFGQGVATTAIQMMSAYAAIANDGVYFSPTIVKNSNLRSQTQKRILSEETAKKLTDMLIRTVEEGTGTNARVPYFKIAGKTSTAQKVSSSGRYDAYVAGFIGFPVNVAKRFVVYVYIDEPSNGTYYGNKVAAPVFKKIVKYMLYKSKEYKDLPQHNIAHNEKIVDQIKVSQSSIRYFGPQLTPKFIGLDKLSSKTMALKHGIRLDNVGFGVVTSQSPAPGEPLDKNHEVRLVFESPKFE